MSDVLDFNDGRMAATRRMTVKPVKCSNELCRFHFEDAIFEQKVLVHIMSDVLQPGKFQPVPMGFKFFCLCGWVYTPDAGEGKPGTISPDMDPTGDGKVTEL
jgi:hypothetical protein